MKTLKIQTIAFVICTVTLLSLHGATALADEASFTWDPTVAGDFYSINMSGAPGGRANIFYIAHEYFGYSVGATEANKSLITAAVLTATATQTRLTVYYDTTTYNVITVINYIP